MPRRWRVDQRAAFRAETAQENAIASPNFQAHGRFMAKHRSPLDDPEKAAFAWDRYKRLMRWMAMITLTVVIAALVLLYRINGMVSIHFYIATALGIGFAMLLMSALMGLVFLSNASGHDDSAAGSLDDDKDD
jgi:hypothetical protein